MNGKKNYDDEYISYVETGESAAVFITRDIASSIQTKDKWVDILSTKGKKNLYGQWNFEEINVEIFPRTKNPIYPKDADNEQIKYITWKTAHEDIDEQRKNKKKGEKFKITLRLINKNQGKYKTVKRIWNKTFERYVPAEWAMTSSCEIRKCRVKADPKWQYIILGVKHL